MIGIEVDETTTTHLIKKIRRMAETTTGGERIIAITELLAMLYFPAAIAKKINKARGDVILTFTNSTYGRFRNRGTEITEDIPGAGTALKLKLELDVRGDIEVKKDKIILKNLEGLIIVWRVLFGIGNGLDEVVITPKKVYIDL